MNYRKRWSDIVLFFFFNDTATTEIYTLSLHDALPICVSYVALLIAQRQYDQARQNRVQAEALRYADSAALLQRSEEHTSELQSQSNLVCRLLLEKKNNQGLRCRVSHGTPPGRSTWVTP